MSDNCVLKVRGDSMTLGLFYSEGVLVRLQPANVMMKPTYASDCEISSTFVVGLMGRF